MHSFVGKTVTKLWVVCGTSCGLYGLVFFGLIVAVDNLRFCTSFVRVVILSIFAVFLSVSGQVIPRFHRPYYNNYLFNTFSSN
jgi:hypothetical protein